MHMKIIIYGTNYGSSKKYAMELSRRTNIQAISYEEVKNLDSYHTIVYVGSLYAGGVLGMKQTFKNLNVSDKNVVLCTVGLADPEDVQNIDSIRKNMKAQLPCELFERAAIFHLRGGIDYSKLNFMHKTMMGLLYKKAKNLPDEKKTADSIAMVETYNKIVDFIDFSRLDLIEKCLNSVYNKGN